MSIQGINVIGVNKTVINDIGVTSLQATGELAISGVIGFVPSGNIQIFNSGNSVVIGSRNITIGELWVSGNTVATPVPVVRGFVRVSGYSRTGVAMQNFTMSASGEMTYVGTDMFVGTATAMGDAAAGGGSDALTISFLRNGVAFNTINRDNVVPSVGGFVNVQTTVILAPNDTIGLAIANSTDTNSPTISNYNFIVC
jgi:hypothetical protein